MTNGQLSGFTALLRRSFWVATLAAIAVFVAACDDDGEFYQSPNGQLRIMHGVADAPLVNVFLNGRRVLSAVDFRHSSGYLTVGPGNYDIRVEAIVPGGNIDVISVDDFPITQATKTTIIAAGDTSDATIEPLVVANDPLPIKPNMARLQVTHASPEAPPVYIALTDKDLPIDQASYIGPLAYTESTRALDVVAGEYRVRVMVGTPSPTFSDGDVVFDSGAIDLPRGLNVQVVAVTSTVPTQTPPGSPISLVLLDNRGSTDLFDVNTGADLQVVHNSPDTDEVNVVVDLIDTAVDEELTIISNLAFGEFEALDPAVAPVAYDVDVVPSAAPTVVALNFQADLMAGMAYTVIANDFFANINPWVLIDDNRSVATEAKVRLVHGSPSAGKVDIYVIPSSLALLPADTDPAFPGVAFGQETGYVSLAPDTYDVYITAQGSDVPVISVTGQPFAAGGVYTAIARDPLPMEMTFGVIALGDF